MPDSILSSEKERIVWLDVLRVLSAFAIVLIHTASSIMEYLPFPSLNWLGADLYLAAARYAVPVFVMISGVFFLNPGKNITLKNIYGKYIFRMLCVLFAWALIRSLTVDIWLNEKPFSDLGISFVNSIKTFWFLPMIIGLYAVTPILRPVTEKGGKVLVEYLILLGFVMGLCIPVAQGLFPKFSLLNDFVTVIKLPVMIFIAHFVFGYYAYTYDLSKRTKYFLYICSVLCILLMAAGAYLTFDDKTSKIFFYAMHGASVAPLAFVLGAGVFILCKDLLSKINFAIQASNWIRRLAAYSLGVYLCHIIIVEVLAHFSFFGKAAFASFFIIPLLAFLIFCAANLIIACLYQVKLIRKYFL